MSVTTDTDWFAVGQQDYDLTAITATHSDDEPEAEAAREQRDELRAHIPNLTQVQLRDYLWGLQCQMEMSA